MHSPCTILLASERGSNLGHLGRDLALVRAFKHRGDHVVLAVPNLRATLGYFGAEAFTLMQAPVLHFERPPTPPSRNFADMLLNYGFANTPAFTAAVDAWLAIIASVRLSQIIYNNVLAPT